MKDNKVPEETSRALETDVDTSGASQTSANDGKTDVPLSMKILSIFVVSIIGFGGHWSSGVTGAMKSTLKRELHINNAQYALLDASKNFIKTVLILASGVVTDRFGGAQTMLWGNAVFSLGAIFIAAAATVRSFDFMIAGFVVEALGDVATQVAQYKIFSSWFAPSNGFASTLAFELGLGKIGSFVGKATANVIAKKLGDFSWVYWMAVFMNLFTNVATLFFWWFTRWCERRYAVKADPATGEKLTESHKKFELGKMLRLPWPFWLVCLFSFFQTTTAMIFATNSTELAEQRFRVSAIKAGWYASMSQYLGFFFVPLCGIFVDYCGHRLTVMLVCAMGMLLSMSLAAWGPTMAGTAASFGIFAVASSLGPTVIIDSIRTSMWHQEVFGSAYSIKIAINNSMTIIIGIVAGVLQDRDNNSYDGVTVLYAAFAAGSFVVGLGLVSLGYFNDVLGRLQWSRRKRLNNGELINQRKEEFETKDAEWNRKFSLSAFVAVLVLMMGGWATFIWGAVSKNYK